MNPGEVARLLAACAMYDFRTVEKADGLAWHHVIGDLDFEDAMEAVRLHYQQSTDRMMPAHVRSGVKAIRDERDRLTPSEPRQLPSRFETDQERAKRGERGAEKVRDVLGELAQRMQDRGHVPSEAMEQLRQITDGPAWAGEIEGSSR